MMLVVYLNVHNDYDYLLDLYLEGEGEAVGSSVFITFILTHTLTHLEVGAPTIQLLLQLVKLCASSISLCNPSVRATHSRSFCAPAEFTPHPHFVPPLRSTPRVHFRLSEGYPPSRAK
jgi:hypothetical protein